MQNLHQWSRPVFLFFSKICQQINLKQMRSLSLILALAFAFVLVTEVASKGGNKKKKSPKNQTIQESVNYSVGDDVPLDTGADDSTAEFSQTLQGAIKKNKAEADLAVSEDPQYYAKHVAGQAPKFLWIGCSDSRVIPQKILGANIGEVFVHRNVANQVNPLDQNVMAVAEYAVKHLKVSTIMIVGHYQCGGVKASLTNQDFGPLESWLSQIRELRYRNHEELSKLEEAERIRRLIQLNVIEQAKQISRTPLVQRAWTSGQKLQVIGVVYDIRTGILKNVMKPMNGLEDIPDFQEFAQ